MQLWQYGERQTYFLDNWFETVLQVWQYGEKQKKQLWKYGESQSYRCDNMLRESCTVREGLKNRQKIKK